MRPALLFVLALVLRLLYLSGIEHLVVQEGDAYYFLSGGSELLKFAQETLAGQHTALADLGKIGETDAQVMSSAALADRLINDGPVITSYMAIVNLLAGVPAGAKDFNSYIWSLGTVISIVGALASVAVYKLAGRLLGCRKAALLAGLFVALYPPGIINVQSCYSEIFCSALVPFWLYFLERVKSKNNFLSWLGLGVLTGTVMLAKPLFYFLPSIIFLFTFYRLAKTDSFSNIFARKFLPLLVGLAVIFVPWLVVTKSIAGKPLLTVNRSPAFNLYLGSDLSRDGWRAYPFQEGIPTDAKVAVSDLVQKFETQPIDMTLLELKKIPRLYAGAWNEFQYPLFGLTATTQEFFHRLFLALGLMGFIALFSSRHKKDRWAALVSGLLILAHLSYCLFEPISRYNFTTFPFLAILAASLLYRARSGITLAPYMVGSALLVYALSNYRHLANFVGSSFLIAALYATTILVLGAFFARSLSARTFRKYAVSTVCSLSLALLILANIPADRCILQTKTILDNSALAEKFALETQPNEKLRHLLLIDMVAGQSPASLTVNINDGKMHELDAFPWILVNREENFLTMLGLQLKGMGKDSLWLRQWWVVSLDSDDLYKSLRVGKNKITLLPHGKATIYGTRLANMENFGGETLYRPSLDLVSWTKGFTTADRVDMRLYEKADAHFEKGIGNGNNMVIIEGAGDNLPEKKYRQAAEVSKSEETSIYGQNPLTGACGAYLPSLHYVPPPSPQNSAPNLLYRLSFQARSLNKNSWKSFASNNVPRLWPKVTVYGQDAAGKPIESWISPLASLPLSLSTDYQNYSVCDFLPARFRKASALRIEANFYPFQEDQAHLQKKRAMRQQAQLKDSKLEIWN